MDTAVVDVTRHLEVCFRLQGIIANDCEPAALLFASKRDSCGLCC